MGCARRHFVPGWLGCALLGVGACASPNPGPPSGGRVEADGSASLTPDEACLPAARVGKRELGARAFAAEAAFLFPERTRALVRGLLRGEFARLEGLRLGIEVPQDALQESVAESLATFRAQIPPGEREEDWIRTQYGCSAAAFRATLERHLADNLRYQLVLRAWEESQTRLRVHLLLTRDEEQAHSWVEELRQGADPRAWAAGSLDPGPHGDAERLLPADLPEPLGGALAGAEVGGTVGPLQLPGDRSWIVARLAERLPPSASQPPVAVLLEGLSERPIGPLEARAWFQAMEARYTAHEGIPSIRIPARVFVPPPRP